MPFDLPLPAQFRGQWKVKIREKERLEPPHVSIIKGTDTWRINLRTGEFMDRKPDPTEVPGNLVDHIKQGRRTKKQSIWEWLCSEWDNKYPDNKIASEDE